MTMVGTEDKNGGVTEKISYIRWGGRIIYDHGGSVKIYHI